MCRRYVARVGDQAGHVTPNGVAKQNYNMKEKKKSQGFCVMSNKNVCLYQLFKWLLTIEIDLLYFGVFHSSSMKPPTFDFGLLPPHLLLTKLISFGFFDRLETLSMGGWHDG